jgi:general secretion pathway protein D/MSHA biogenesis protein MshL
MKKKTRSMVTLFASAAICLLLNTGCAPGTTTQTSADPLATQTPAPAPQAKSLQDGQLPVRFQNPAYMLGDPSVQNMGAGNGQGATIPVGYDISSNTGPVPLHKIMKRLATQKGMNISWASDVDQKVEVDVDIRAEDDFFTAIDNILRQMDYFHEVQGNTIVIKYRETRKFHVAMPFIKSTYNTGVGGDVLGGGETKSGLQGNIQLTSTDNQFDIWENIRQNLDQMLGIWEETVTAPPLVPTTTVVGQEKETALGATSSTVAAFTTMKRDVKSAKGFYSIDKPVGLITVTAPRPLVDRIAVYLDNLKTELYRQISIEAKIVEVSLDDTESRGIDWTNFLSGKALDFQLFGPQGIIYSPIRDLRSRAVSQVSVGPNPFSLALNFLDTQGHTSVLANPKLNVMNGQPGLITAGDSITYIDKVVKTKGTAESPGDTFTPTTAKLMSGIGMSVIGTILDNDEIILTLTPVTSKLDGDTVAIEVFADGTRIGLPRVKLREMNTTVRIKSGQVVVIGGLIDNAESTDVNGQKSTKVPFLGNIPILGKLFSHSAKSTKKNELVIMLQPIIL